MNARHLVMVVLLLGLIPWVVLSINCGLGGEPLEKMPTYTAGGGGGGDPIGPGDSDPPGEGEDPAPPSDHTISTVISVLVQVSDLYDSPDEVEINRTLWQLGIDNQRKIIDFAGALEIPPEVWAAFKAERTMFQIDDDWFWWFSQDLDLETFIYSMTLMDVAWMAEGYQDWPLAN